LSLLTIFSAPKPFADPRIAMIQANAIASWVRLEDVEVFLMGDDQGIAEAAKRLGVVNLPRVSRNRNGTPLISSMVQLARENGHGALFCIINADMIVMPDLVDAGRQVMTMEREFLLLGRRWDLDIDSPIGFDMGWEDDLRAAVQQRGILHRPAGSDFFIFPRECYRELPDFAVGRAGWDNWMIYKARRSKWPVIDATPSITMIHQNHDYGHLPGGEPHYTVPESNENIRLAGGDAPIRYTVVDATHCLKQGRLSRPTLSYLRFMRGMELFLRAVFFFLPANMIEELSRPKRWKKRFLKILGK
jgi:hypothetical protein